MSGLVFTAVLIAALLHASWNAMVKGARDKQLNMIAVVIGHVPLAIVMLLLAPAPDLASLPYLFSGMGLHFGYQLFLIRAYKVGDLTQVCEPDRVYRRRFSSYSAARVTVFRLS
jgi:hypothetical protein